MIIATTTLIPIAVLFDDSFELPGLDRLDLTEMTAGLNSFTFVIKAKIKQSKKRPV